MLDAVVTGSRRTAGNNASSERASKGVRCRRKIRRARFQRANSFLPSAYVGGDAVGAVMELGIAEGSPFLLDRGSPNNYSAEKLALMVSVRTRLFVSGFSRESICSNVSKPFSRYTTVIFNFRWFGQFAPSTGFLHGCRHSKSKVKIGEQNEALAVP
jgi:hypothetical protein